MGERKPESVESQDDWVILDRVIYANHDLRKGVDWIEYGAGWTPVDGYAGSTVEEFLGESHHAAVRCRRRDLPQMQQEAPKPNYVRLWTHRTSGTVCTATDEKYLKYPDIWTELKHDGTGFYLSAD